MTDPDLLIDDRIEVGVVYKDSPFLMNTAGEQLKLDQAVTDAVHTITLTATPPNRHHGVLNTGVILDNGSEGNPAIDIQTGFVTIEWIELHKWRHHRSDFRRQRRRLEPNRRAQRVVPRRCTTACMDFTWTMKMPTFSSITISSTA